MTSQVLIKKTPQQIANNQPLACTDCSICPRRHNCPQGSHIKGQKLPDHGFNCPGTQGLADDKGGIITLPRTASRPLFQLEWNDERIKVTRERLESAMFDPFGRPISFSTHGSVWKRGLDGRVLEISHVPGDESRLPACYFHEGRLISTQEAEKWLKWLDELLEQAREFFPNHPALVLPSSFDRDKDSSEFLKIFKPVGILPPDQVRALVLQLTNGCSHNKCTFCSFFKKDVYRVKGMDEFEDHVHKALGYFGKSIAAKQGIFIGEGNGGNLPTDVLVSAMRLIKKIVREHTENDNLDPNKFKKFYSFLDTFTVNRTVDGWAELADEGLDRLYLGLESGSKEILNLLHKPGNAEMSIKLIKDLKKAGVNVGPIVMTGVGGDKLADRHLKDTADMLNAMPLGSGDKVYLSEFLTVPGSEYEKLANQLGINPLNRMKCREQTRALRSMLTFAPPPLGPTISLYDVRQFIY